MPPDFPRPRELKDSISQNPFFETLAVGSFTPVHVLVETMPPTAKPEALLDMIEHRWVDDGSNPRSFRKTISLLQNPTISKGTLELVLTTSNFAEYIATRTEDVRTQYRSFMPAIDPVEVGILVVTKDDKLILTQRPPDAAIKPSAMSVISGYPELEEDELFPDAKDDLDRGGKWDPFLTVTRELEEEGDVYIHELEVPNTTLTGVIYNKSSNQPAITFVTKTILTSEQIRARELGGHTEGDFDLRFISNSRDSIERHILSFAPSPNPLGTASLLFYGRREFGEEWFAEMNRRLTQEYLIHIQRSDSDRKAFEQQGVEYFLTHST